VSILFPIRKERSERIISRITSDGPLYAVALFTPSIIHQVSTTVDIVYPAELPIFIIAWFVFDLLQLGLA
jgi:hypothetical protein